MVGFGLSPLVTAPIVSALIAAVGPLRTFLYRGLAFTAILMVLPFPLRFPPSGWMPAGGADHAQRKAPSPNSLRRPHEHVPPSNQTNLPCGSKAAFHKASKDSETRRQGFVDNLCLSNY